MTEQAPAALGTDIPSVQGERVALDGDDVVPGGGERQDELAVARADDLAPPSRWPWISSAAVSSAERYRHIRASTLAHLWRTLDLVFLKTKISIFLDGR